MEQSRECEVPNLYIIITDDEYSSNSRTVLTAQFGSLPEHCIGNGDRHVVQLVDKSRPSLHCVQLVSGSRLLSLPQSVTCMCTLYP